MTQFDISWATLWRIFFFVALIVMLYAAKDVLIILFLAIILSAGLDAPVSALEKRNVPRILSAIFIFLIAITALGFVLYALVPPAAQELRSFTDHLSRLQLPVFGPVDTSIIVESLNKNLHNISSAVVSGGGSVFNFIFALFGNIILIIATIVLTFYLTIDREGVPKFLRAILPPFREDQAIDIYNRVRRRFGLWLQGQLLLMIIIGVLVFLGLWLLGVPYALVIALLAGVFEIVPVVGPIFTGTIAFLIALSQSFTMGIYAIAFFVIIQQLENHLLVPIVMRRTVGVNPVVVVIALLIGSQIAGFIGILLAVPAVVIFDEILEEWGAEKARRRDSRLEF